MKKKITPIGDLPPPPPPSLRQKGGPEKEVGMHWAVKVVGAVCLAAIIGAIVYLFDEIPSSLSSPEPSYEGAVERLEINPDGNSVIDKKPTSIRLNIEPSFN
jgi:hypothetical protein